MLLNLEQAVVFECICMLHTYAACMQQNTIHYNCILTHRGANPVGFRINQASDLGEVAVSLCDKLDGGGLHEESVVRGEHTVNAFVNVLHHH